MRVLVCGGRNYKDHAHVFSILDEMHAASPITVIIHGDATGADSLAKKWAKQRGVRCKPYPADWDDTSASPVVLRRRRDGTSYNAAAGGIRNQRMLDDGKPDVVVAFPGGNGTADMVARTERAIKAGTRVQLVRR